MDINNITNKKQNLDTHPYKCKVCGKEVIEHEYRVCSFCGWQDDSIQNDDPNFMGGANKMSLNQYKRYLDLNRDDILKSLEKDKFYAIKKTKEYYQKNHIEDMKNFINRNKN